MSLLDKYNISVMQATPATWQGFASSRLGRAFNFKILTAGEALSKDLAKLLQQRGIVYNIYGPTGNKLFMLLCYR